MHTGKKNHIFFFSEDRKRNEGKVVLGIGEAVSFPDWSKDYCGGCWAEFPPPPLNPLPCTSSCFLCPKDLLTVLVSGQLFSFPVPSTHTDPLSSAKWNFLLGAFQGLPISLFTMHIHLLPCSYPPSLGGCYHHPVTGPAQRNHLCSLPPIPTSGVVHSSSDGKVFNKIQILFKSHSEIPLA